MKNIYNIIYKYYNLFANVCEHCLSPLKQYLSLEKYLNSNEPLIINEFE